MGLGNSSGSDRVVPVGPGEAGGNECASNQNASGVSSHTPGPWFHFDFDSEIPHGRPYIIAQTVTVTSFGPARGCIVTCGEFNPNAGTYWPARGLGGRTDDEARANARLIAAAPDLLAALEKLVGDVRDIHDIDTIMYDDVLNARAAIAKAKGGAR